jgi:hypothetical protein
MRHGQTQRGQPRSHSAAMGNHARHHDDHDEQEIPTPSGCYLTAQEFAARPRSNDPGMPTDDGIPMDDEEAPIRRKRSRQ